MTLSVARRQLSLYSFVAYFVNQRAEPAILRDAEVMSRAVFRHVVDSGTHKAGQAVPEHGQTCPPLHRRVRLRAPR